MEWEPLKKEAQLDLLSEIGYVYRLTRPWVLEDEHDPAPVIDRDGGPVQHDDSDMSDTGGSARYVISQSPALAGVRATWGRAMHVFAVALPCMVPYVQIASC